MNLTAIASALATRFGAAAITPPTGYSDPGTATHLMPTAITTTPTCVVFPPECEFTYYGFSRTGNLDFPVRWYIGDASDLPRATLAMYDWGGVLLGQLQSSYDLDLSPTVTHATIVGTTFGRMEYAGIEYTGLEVNVRVHVSEAFNPTT